MYAISMLDCGVHLPAQIHWLSIINSIVLVFLLLGFVMLILVSLCQPCGGVHVTPLAPPFLVTGTAQ